MGKLLRISGNNSTQIVKLEGRKTEPEPSEFRVEFPGGFVCVARVDGDGARPKWWAHIGVFHPAHHDRHQTANLDANGDPGPTASIVDGRVDCFDRHASETVPLAAALVQPNVYRVAVKIEEGGRTALAAAKGGGM